MADIEKRLNNLLHKIAKEHNLEDYEIQVTDISTGGANYSSTLHLAKITSKNKDDLELFIKIGSLGIKVRETYNITIFNVEQMIYMELKKIYMELEDKHKLPAMHRLRMAKYYGADSTPPNEMLVLENLSVQGFTVHDRMKSIDWQYAAIAVKELVKLHSLSMSFQRENPEKFKEFTEKHQLKWMTEAAIDSLWIPGFKKAIQVAPEKNKEKLRKFFGQFDLEKVTELYEPLRCKVITHGDFRPSNLMHRKRDDGSFEVITVDYQTLQVGCPINDLLYLIFTGTDKEFREKYYDQLIHHYYTQLSEAMNRLGIDPETAYSRADFHFELKEKLPHGLVMAAFTLPFVTVETENAPDFSCDNDMSSFANLKTGRLFPERINGVVDDYIRWGLLND